MKRKTNGNDISFFFFFGEKEKDEKTKSWAEGHSKLLNDGKAKIKE